MKFDPPTQLLVTYRLIPEGPQYAVVVWLSFIALNPVLYYHSSADKYVDTIKNCTSQLIRFNSIKGHTLFSMIDTNNITLAGTRKLLKDL